METHREGTIETWEGLRKHSDCGQRVKRGKDTDLGGQRLRDRMFPLGTWWCGSCLPQPLPPPSPPDYDERSHLHDAFTQMTHALQELAAAQGECVGMGRWEMWTWSSQEMGMCEGPRSLRDV